MRLRAFALALALAVLVLANSVRAADAPGGEPVRVEYMAPGDCPGQGAFETELAGHLGSATFARFGELARTLSVAIEPEPQGFRARVELVDRRGQSTQRGISAPTCEQAMKAIALVAALAARSQIEQADREREGEASAAAAAAAAPDAPAAPAGASVESAREAPAPERSAPAAPREETSLSFGVSAGAAASTGVGPRLAPGLLVALRLALTGASEHSIVLSALGYDTFRTSLDVAEVRFNVLKARVELCPIEPRLSARLLVSPCAGFELGSQTGQSYADGVRVETPGKASELWVALTLAARLGIRFGAFTVGLGPELGVPLQRNRFALTQPNRSVYQVPRVTVGGMATAGLVW
jgi:hypothetical protein